MAWLGQCALMSCVLCVRYGESVQHFKMLFLHSQDYIFTEGDLLFQPGETRKEVQVPLLELTEIDTLLHTRQLKQFTVDLLNPKYGAKIGRYPQTVVTIADPGGCGQHW